MVSFLVCVAILILGYVFYGKYVEKVFKPDDRMTPAYKHTDGIDYIPIRTWRAYLIQLLNIAGTGPIFGALSGALFGPIVYLWIVFGCIFAGAVHDYLCGMISEREDGGSVSEIVGEYLGVEMKYFMRIFSIILLIMCGVV
ncbi:MAG: carbon starvation protein A, partial [Lachnospiraceae bacterium]|nr:carbon starvation protein A [Lachnospiraceae bacterium]